MSCLGDRETKVNFFKLTAQDPTEVEKTAQEGPVPSVASLISDVYTNNEGKLCWDCAVCLRSTKATGRALTATSKRARSHFRDQHRELFTRMGEPGEGKMTFFFSFLLVCQTFFFSLFSLIFSSIQTSPKALGRASARVAGSH